MKTMHTERSRVAAGFAAGIALFAFIEVAQNADTPGSTLGVPGGTSPAEGSQDGARARLDAMEAETALLRGQLAGFEKIQAEADQSFLGYENFLKAEREARDEGRGSGVTPGPIAASANQAIGRGDLAKEQIQRIKKRVAELEAQIGAARAQLAQPKDASTGTTEPTGGVGRGAAKQAEAALLRGQLADFEKIQAEADQNFLRYEHFLKAEREARDEGRGSGVTPGPIAAEANQAIGRGDLAKEQIRRIKKRVAELEALGASEAGPFHVVFAVQAPDVLQKKPENVKYKDLLQNLALRDVRWVREENRKILISVAGEGLKAYRRDKFTAGTRFSAPVNIATADPKTGKTSTLAGAFLLETIQTADGAPAAADPKNQPVVLVAQSEDGKYSARLEQQGSAQTQVNGGPLVEGWPEPMQLAALDLLKQIAQAFDCFVATAVYRDNPHAPQVATFRRFRDEFLLATEGGRRFVEWYYRNGPALADAVRERPRMIPVLRAVFDRLARWLENAWPDARCPGGVPGNVAPGVCSGASQQAAPQKPQ